MAEQPRNPFARLTDEELERALADLGAHLTFPTTPALAAAVRTEVARGPAARRVGPTPFPVRRVLAAAAVVLLAVVAALALSSGFRSTVADFFGIKGVRIVIERETPTPTATATGTAAATPIASPSAATPTATPTAAATPIGTGLLLGRQVTLDEARAGVPYPLQVPTLPRLGQPDEVYLRTLPDGNRMVSFIYLPAPGLPETEQTGVGALLMQFKGRDDVPYIGKSISEGYAMEEVEVNGEPGIWIAGSHQMTLLPDPSLGCCRGPTRSAGNVLLWEQDGITFRLESALDEDAALAIAESVAVPTEATPNATPGN
jgi:hypothetical protein